MTDINGAENFTDDIVEEPSTATRLDREASAFLSRSERRPSGPTTSVRQAVREDLDQGRQWARDRVGATRDAITDQPMISTLYALGAGVLIGLLIRR